MSRYNISPRNDNSLEITVGWDNQLNTLFAHVIRPGTPYDPEVIYDDDEIIEDEFILMMGNRLNEILSIDDLANLVSKYADIPYNIKKALAFDMAQPYERSSFQDWMINNGLVY